MSVESVEQFFLKYGFPCAHVLLQVGFLSQEQYDKLEQAARSNTAPSREILEASFPAAFRRIKKLAKVMSKDLWDFEVMRNYWHHQHNIEIDHKEGSYNDFPESFCEFCKTHVATIKELLPQNFLLIKYDNTTRPVNGEYIANAKIGDIVRIHHAHAIERVNN